MLNRRRLQWLEEILFGDADEWDSADLDMGDLGPVDQQRAEFFKVMVGLGEGPHVATPEEEREIHELTLYGRVLTPEERKAKLAAVARSLAETGISH